MNALVPSLDVPLTPQPQPIADQSLAKPVGLLPPAAFWAHASTDLAPLIDDEELWIFARVDGEDEDAFAEASSDLLVQLKTVHQLPICILALTDVRTHAFRRAYLDPAPGADGPILELLRRDFHAMVVVYGHHGRVLRSFRLEAPRSANANMIVERLAYAPQPLPERWEQAVEACRLAPPPVGQFTHPFTLEPEAPTAADALLRLQALEPWSSSERIEEALMLLSIPGTVIELSRRRVVGDALRFGLAMSNDLVLQAVSFGFAADAQAFVDKLARRFDEIVPCASEQGLDDVQVEANREALEQLSALYGTSTERELSCNMENSG